MTLDHICACYDTSRGPLIVRYAMNDCYNDESYVLKCDGEHLVGALPFTNKGYYICPFDMDGMERMGAHKTTDRPISIFPDKVYRILGHWKEQVETNILTLLITTNPVFR